MNVKKKFKKITQKIKKIKWEKHTNFIIYLLSAGIITGSAYYVYYKKTVHHHTSQLNFKEKDFVKKYYVENKIEKTLDRLSSSLDMRIQAILDGQPSILTNNQIDELFQRKNFSVLSLKRNIKHEVAHLVLTHPKLPNHIIKVGCDSLKPRYNISRLILAEHIQNLIDNPSLEINNVEKPNKKLYHRKGRPNQLTDFNYLVLSKKVNGVPYDKAPLFNQKTTDKINDDAFVVINYLQPDNAKHLFFSLNSKNILITPEKKVAFIDTAVHNNNFRKELLNLYFNSPNKKEQMYIQKHLVEEQEGLLLDSIFKGISKEALAILDGNIENKTHKQIARTLKKSDLFLLTKDVLKSKSLVLSHPKIPNHLIKIGIDKNNQQKAISRLVYANKLCALIANKNNNLVNMQALRKKLYQRPGKPNAFVDANYTIITPKIAGKSYTKVATEEKLADQVISIIWTVLLDKEIIYPKESVAFHEFHMDPNRLVVTPENKAIFRNTCIKNAKRRKRWLNKLFRWTPTPNKDGFLGVALLTRYSENT